MPGSVKVSHDGGVVFAEYVGDMDKATLDEANGRIRQLLEQSRARRILYDTLRMSDPSMDLALQMKKFDASIRPLLDRAATVVLKSSTAFMARAAFAFTKDHRVFYQSRDEALQWLREKV